MFGPNVSFAYNSPWKLSVAAIVYYGAGLVGYLAKGLKSVGVHLNPDTAVAIAIPVIAGLCIFAIQRAHHRLARSIPELIERLPP